MIQFVRKFEGEELSRAEAWPFIKAGINRMQALLFTLIAFGGVNSHTASEEGCSESGCKSCRSGALAAHCAAPKGGVMGMMPQTCYAPRYGCYPGTERYTNRYPAFHGSFYRAAYNYRNYFDYPWHAEPHEPTSMFSYETEHEVEDAPAPMITPGEPTRTPAVQRTIPPQPAPAKRSSPQSSVKSAEYVRTGRETLAPIVEPAVARANNLATPQIAPSVHSTPALKPGQSLRR